MRHESQVGHPCSIKYNNIYILNFRNQCVCLPSSKHLSNRSSLGCDKHSKLKSFHDEDHSFVNVFKQSLRHPAIVAFSQQCSFTLSMPSFSICDIGAGADVSFCSARSLCKKHCQNRS
jgi:hypothetical protein